VDGNVPPFQGTVARVDLSYTLLARTRFTVTGERDLSYSYRIDQRDYLQTGADLTVTQRLANAWDVNGNLSRFALIYGLGDPNGRAERITSYGFGVGYHIEKTRFGLQLGRQTRSSDFSADRGYEGMRIASSVDYRF
jgi:hypothetical protein